MNIPTKQLKPVTILKGTPIKTIFMAEPKDQIIYNYIILGNLYWYKTVHWLGKSNPNFQIKIGIGIILEILLKKTRI